MFYEGVDGLKQAYEHILLEAAPICAIVDPDQMMKVMDNEYMWNWVQRRADKGISYKGIIKDGEQGRIAKKRDKEQRREIHQENPQGLP